MTADRDQFRQALGCLCEWRAGHDDGGATKLRFVVPPEQGFPPVLAAFLDRWVLPRVERDVILGSGGKTSVHKVDHGHFGVEGETAQAVMA